MADMDTTNARIKSTSLGYEDHGIMTFYLHLDYGGGGQGFGGYGLDDFDKEKDRRVGTAFGLEAIIQVLKTVGVDTWEKLPGTPVRVRQNHMRIQAIGHFLRDDWLDLSVLAREMGLA